MNEFIGNNIKFLAEWGQWLMAAFFVLCAVLLFLLVRRNKHFLPRGFGGWLASIVLGLLMLFSAAVFLRITRVKPQVMVIINQLESLKNAPAPELEFLLVSDSMTHRLGEYKGKVVLINFWATWCAPCVKELPDLNRLQQTYGEDGLVVLAISDETLERVRKYAEKKPFSLSAGLVSSFDWVNLGSERPASFLVDRNGIVQEYYTGPYNFEYFEREIRPLLKK